MSDEPKPQKPPDLNVTARRIEFSQAPQVDAEGQLAKVSFDTRVGGGFGRENSGALGSIPGRIEYGTTAGELANGARAACVACRHWSPRAWVEYVNKSTGTLSSAQDRETIATMKQRLARAYGPENVSEAMRSMGICRVLTEVIEGWVGKNPIHWPVVTKDDANCPGHIAAGQGELGIPNRLEIVTPAAPFGLFKAKDLEAVKVGDLRRDSILFDAAGKSR